MAIVVRNTTSVAVEEETTEGTYVAPAGASSFIQTLADGFEMSPAKETIERNVFTGTIGKVTPRTGTRSISGTLPVEFRADATLGSAPEYDKLAKAALGARRQNTTDITTKASGNTASVLQIEDADISKIEVNDIILVKQAGAYHLSPVIAKSVGAGTATVTMLNPHPSGDCADSVVIAKFTTYYMAESGHKTLSITKYLDGAITETAIGCRPTSMSLEGFSTGSIPNLSFGFEGIDFASSVAAPGFTPSYDAALPPIVLNAHAYIDGAEVEMNEVSFSVENTVAFATAFKYSNVKISSRITQRAITGSIDPYKKTDSVADFTKFLNGTEFSLFGYAAVETGVTGEFQNIVAFYMPKCLITEIAETDADGLLKNTLSFQATRGSAGDTNELSIGII
jgi:hypothetical protein